MFARGALSPNQRHRVARSCRLMRWKPKLQLLRITAARGRWVQRSAAADIAGPRVARVRARPLAAGPSATRAIGECARRAWPDQGAQLFGGEPNQGGQLIRGEPTARVNSRAANRLLGSTRHRGTDPRTQLHSGSQLDGQPRRGVNSNAGITVAGHVERGRRQGQPLRVMRRGPSLPLAPSPPPANRSPTLPAPVPSRISPTNPWRPLSRPPRQPKPPPPPLQARATGRHLALRKLLEAAWTAISMDVRAGVVRPSA
eukprot:142433-Pyramimonas_sp.AAC.3